jgi:hypothetical protein
MSIAAYISCDGHPVADITYRPGLHVEVRVAKGFQDAEIRFFLRHSPNQELAGTWEQALDWYFNAGIFDSKDSVYPGEMRRVGCARDHKSLFRTAVQALRKDIEQHGFEVTVEFF